MTLDDLISVILSLRSEASLSCWALEPPYPAEDDPSVTRHVLFGYTVCWSTSNTSPCPTEEEITAYQNQF